MKAQIKKGVCFGCHRVFTYADKGMVRRFCNKECYVKCMKNSKKKIWGYYKNILMGISFVIGIIIVRLILYKNGL